MPYLLGPCLTLTLPCLQPCPMPQSTCLEEEVHKLSLSLQAVMEDMQQSASEAKQVSVMIIHAWSHLAT